MRLRAIELANVRRFAGKRAVLAGIGDGITVLAAPNEFGKSTFFDALQAVFFERHRSRNARVAGLQPHAGGAPEVAVEVEVPDGRFRIAKRWLARPSARVTDAAGRLIAQEDEAEAWIDRLTEGDLAGPAGLLWVRQGLLGLEPEDKAERARGLVARRDLLSSVAGEIDAMTGGRRMDAVRDRVTRALEPLATATGRPKAGGPWAAALAEAEALAAEEEALRPRAVALSGDLARRSEVSRALARLTDPADVAAREAARQEAEVGLRAAQDHRGRVDAAEAVLRAAMLDADSGLREVARIGALAARVEQARAALDTAEAHAAALRATEAGARDRATGAAAALDAAVAAVRDLRGRLDRAVAAQAARQAAAQVAELQRRAARAAALQDEVETARARRAGMTITPRALAAAEAAQTALEGARARAAAQAVTVEALPDGAPARIGDAVLPPGPHPVTGPVEIALPGFGRLRVDPGPLRGDAAGLAAAEAALDRALAACGADSLALARQALAAAQDLDAAVAQGVALLAEVAPDGVVPLRAALAQAQVAAGVEAPVEAEDADALAGALAAAEAAEAEARAAAKAAQAQAAEAGEARAAADGGRATAARHLEEASAAAGEPVALAAALEAARDRLPALEVARRQAEAALEGLRAAAPDLETAEARAQRARGAVEEARRAEAAAREELAGLNARIEGLAAQGIEERLSAVAEARAEAEARAARYGAEVRALTRLARALEDARGQARAAYFAPVLRELQPLLAILHPGAAVSLDDQTLLPGGLTRDGQDEALDILSGGTREQIAVLTRLAFARLFARSGRHVPVILDDALVHSDDDRIEAMFTALHRTARDQQILVLTCRARAFAALGGARAEVAVSEIG